MIKTVLFDLGNALIRSNPQEFYRAYCSALDSFGSEQSAIDHLGKHLDKAFISAMRQADVTAPLNYRLFSNLSRRLRLGDNELQSVMAAFFSDRYAALQPLTHPRPEAPSLLRWLFEHDYSVVIAANPVLMQDAISKQLDWGAIPLNQYPYTFVATLDNVHFGKSQPEYFEEILLRLDLGPGEAIMVGDDWEHDMMGAADIGLRTYWITDLAHSERSNQRQVDGAGTLQQFAEKVRSGWLESLSPLPVTRTSLLHRLRVFPAAMDTVRREVPAEALVCAPGAQEWSARDIFCHLRDHELSEDRMRLERIEREANPFLSANYYPWADAHAYRTVSVDQAFEDFARNRRETVNWVAGLESAIWDRTGRSSIFGPTSFEEMVRFTTEHDRTHLRQIRDTIKAVQEPCTDHLSA